VLISLILAAIVAGATAVIYGTDAFCALAWCRRQRASTTPVYLRISAPVNRTLIRAAADAEPAADARALQRRWNSVIGVRVALQGIALALLLATLVAHV
jgi:hypothetical protein